MIITLTTDFGLQDAYVGIIKGVILGIADPEVRIVDITHDVPPQDIGQAAFILNSAYPYFPKGTVHAAIVDPGVGTERAVLLVLAGGHQFLAPDNGLLMYVFDAYPDAVIYKLTNPDYFLKPVSRTFHGRDIFAPIAAYLAKGIAPDLLGFGERFEQFIRGTVKHPIVKAGKITGEIIFIDHFGNAATNIQSSQIDNPSHAEIRIRKHVIRGIQRTYLESQPGKPAALIGSHGNLEIGVNCGSAEKALSLSVGDSVSVFFKLEESMEHK